MVLTLELDVKTVQSPTIQTVHPVFAGQLDTSGANKPRYIITARALDEPVEEEFGTETDHHETTEYVTDETEEAVTEERFSSTENSLFTSTSAPSYSTELAPTVSIADQSLVARTGEAVDTQPQVNLIQNSH